MLENMKIAATADIIHVIDGDQNHGLRLKAGSTFSLLFYAVNSIALCSFTNDVIFIELMGFRY